LGVDVSVDTAGSLGGEGNGFGDKSPAMEGNPVFNHSWATTSTKVDILQRTVRPIEVVGMIEGDCQDDQGPEGTDGGVDGETGPPGKLGIIEGIMLPN